MGASPAAPIPAHRPTHFRRRHCRLARRLARHGASHRRPRWCRPHRPLNRRGAPLRRVPRRRFPDIPCSTNQALTRPGGPWFHTPRINDAKGACARLRGIFGAIRRLSGSIGVPELLGRACIGATHGDCHDWGVIRRRLSPTDTRPPCARTRNKHGAIHARHALELRGPWPIPCRFAGAGHQSGRDLHPATARDRQASGRFSPPLRASRALPTALAHRQNRSGFMEYSPLSW